MVKTALAVNEKRPLLNSLKTSSICIQTQPPYFSTKNVKWPFSSVMTFMTTLI